MSTSTTVQIGQNTYYYQQELGSLYGPHNLKFTLEHVEVESSPEAPITYNVDPWPLFTDNKTREQVIAIALTELGRLRESSTSNPEKFQFEAPVEDLPWTFTANLVKV